MSSDKNKDNF